MLTMVLIPICFCIAIVRFNLFDIDRLLSATAAYTIVSVLVLAGALTVVPRLAQTISLAVGFDPGFGQTVCSFLLAALIVPGQRFLRPQIKRLFFAERYALERGVEDLLRELALEAEPLALLTLTGERLATLLRPECCVLYGQAGDAYAPVFVRGRTAPPTFAPVSALLQTLQVRTAPFEIESWRRTKQERLAPDEQASLDSFGAAVLLPVSHGVSLPAFLVLGPKRSGDIYTATDLALLTAVAHKLSGELLHFAEREIRRQMQAMQTQLLSTVSHELRTPLTVIKGSADNMLDGLTGQLTDKQLRYLTHIKTNSDRLDRLTTEILDLSRMEAGKVELKPTLLLVAALTTEVADSLRSVAAEKQLSLAVVSSTPNVTAWADRDKVTQVLLNLMGDALKFTPAQGTVTVVLQEDGAEWVQISVADTGPGIPAAEAEKIFDSSISLPKQAGRKPQGPDWVWRLRRAWWSCTAERSG